MAASALIAVAVGVGITASGLFVILSTRGTELEPFGWLLMVVGVMSVAGNALLSRRRRN